MEEAKRAGGFSVFKIRAGCSPVLRPSSSTSQAEYGQNLGEPGNRVLSFFLH